MNLKILPAHILRLYAWELLKNNTDIWSPDNLVNGLIPIVPVEDEPKLADAGRSYLIYGFSESPGGSLNEIRQGNIAFRISGRNFAEMGEIINILARGFENLDDSAEAINMWSSLNALVSGNIRFTMTDVTYIENSPPETEGGPSDGVVNIAFEYVTHQTVKTFTGTTWA